MSVPVFGKRLREARAARGLSQAGLAVALPGDVTQSAVSYWESGRSLPTVENLCDLCRLLSVSADWLLGLEAGAATRDADRLARALAELPAERRRLVTDLLPYLGVRKRRKPR